MSVRAALRPIFLAALLSLSVAVPARAGLIEFRRRVEQLQHNVVVHLFCRPVWDRFVRFFHWSLVAAFFTAWFTREDVDTAHEVGALDLRAVGPLSDLFAPEAEFRAVNFPQGGGTVLVRQGRAAIVRVCKEAGWPAPTPTTIQRVMTA